MLDKFTRLLDIEIFPWILDKASPSTVEFTDNLLIAWLVSRMGDGVLLDESLEPGLDRSAASS